MGPRTLTVDEPPPPAGTEESVEGEALPDPEGEPEEEGEDWDDPDDDTPVLREGK